MFPDMATTATLSLPAWLTASAAQGLAVAMAEARRQGADPARAAREAAQALMPSYPWPMIEEAARWALGLR